MTEWDIRSMCWWSGLSVGQYYKVVMSVYCHILLRYALDLARCKDSLVGYGIGFGYCLGGNRGMNPVTAITFSYAAIHFPGMYNLVSSKASSAHTMSKWCGRLKIP